MDVVATLGQWESWLNRMLIDRRMADGGGGDVAARVVDDHSAGLWRRRGSRGAVLRAGQLVPRRRGADAVHRVVVGGAESSPSNVPAEYITSGPHPCVEVVRFGAAAPTGGLVEGTRASAGDGHHQRRRWTARHLRR